VVAKVARDADDAIPGCCRTPHHRRPGSPRCITSAQRIRTTAARRPPGCNEAASAGSPACLHRHYIFFEKVMSLTSVIASAADPGAALNAFCAATSSRRSMPGRSSSRNRATAPTAWPRRSGADVDELRTQAGRGLQLGVGALLNRTAAALDDFDATWLAVPEPRRRARQCMCTRRGDEEDAGQQLQLVNRLQAQAAKALEQAKRRSAEFDLDWERLQDQVEQTLKSFESLHDRIAKVRSAMASAKPLTLPMAETGEEDANKIAGAEPASNVVRLRRELSRIDDAV
jgi:hypothetical protein